MAGQHVHCTLELCRFCGKVVCEQMEGTWKCEQCDDFMCPTCADDTILCEVCGKIVCVNCVSDGGCEECEKDLCDVCYEDHECSEDEDNADNV